MIHIFEDLAVFVKGIFDCSACEIPMPFSVILILNESAGYHNLLKEFPKTLKEVKENGFEFFQGSVIY